MKALIKWFQTRKQYIKHDQYVSGFDYALGAIARGEKTPLALDAEQYGLVRNAFDDGTDVAIDYAITHKLVKDDRMW